MGDPWERFGLYNRYVLIRDDGNIKVIPAHAGELVPGSTEDLVEVLKSFDPQKQHPIVPMTLELDPTNLCYSKNCGTHCFSAKYRSLNPTGMIPQTTLSEIILEFASNGGRIVRFDGGGDPLAHPAIRNGEMPELAGRLGLKSTILTSGDALLKTDLKRIAKAGTYMRISLNSAKDSTRKKFHGNEMGVNIIFNEIKKFSQWLSKRKIKLPIGATYLIGQENYKEVYACAIKAKNVGFSHFSVRRVLGPKNLRPSFSSQQEDEIIQQLVRTSELNDWNFRVFVPWRPIQEEDLNPSKRDFHAQQCWQSTLKTIIEPDKAGNYNVQLCGRYRGSGYGQKMQMRPIYQGESGTNWVNAWRASFSVYPVSRPKLINTCISCIDRGFINMIDEMISFLNPPFHSFKVIHLKEIPN